MSIAALLSPGDWVALVGIFVTVILSTIVVVSQNRNRTQKDFFIKEVDQLKTDYIDFTKEIRNQKLSSEAIRDGFKIFSYKIRTLDEILRSEYRLKKNNVFDRHGVFQRQVTSLESVERQYSEPAVQLSSEELTRLDEGLQNVHRSMIELIISINKAQLTAPWDEDDNLL